MLLRSAIPGLALAFVAGGVGNGVTAMAQEIKRTELSRAPLSGDDTREIVMQLVEFPPGSTSPRHFHNGEEAFYVIEGGTVQVPGTEPKDRLVGERGINQRGMPHAGVGRPLPPVEIKLAPDSSEVLMRTPWMMTGYFRDPERSAQVLRDGFVHSGDTGRFDAKGNLHVIGRVNDTFKTSKGKFVVPAPIEAAISSWPAIDQVLVTGRGLAQPIALVCLSEAGQKCAREEREQLEAELSRALVGLNAALAAHERLSRVVVIGQPFSLESGLLTPTLKVRRHAVETRYGAQFDAWSGGLANQAKQGPIIWDTSDCRS